MAAMYKLAGTPKPLQDDNKQLYHARVVSNGTKTTKDIIKASRGLSTISPADIKGALQLFHDIMADFLMVGYNVELEGIGTFSLSAQCQPVTSKKEIRGESIHFKDVNFRSSKLLRDRLKATPFFKAAEDKREKFTPEQCENRLIAYLNTHDMINCSQYMGLCHCCKSKAEKDLKKFYEEGKINRTHFGTSHYYSLRQLEE